MSRAKKRKTGAEGVKWDLTDLYRGIDDIKLERDFVKIRKNADKFEKRYRNKIKSRDNK